MPYNYTLIVKSSLHGGERMLCCGEYMRRQLSDICLLTVHINLLTTIYLVQLIWIDCYEYHADMRLQT